jgi:dUTP pyrophosphatase
MHGPIRPDVLHYSRHVPHNVDVLLSFLTGADGTAHSTEPSYAHPGDAGADLVAAEALVLAPGQRATVGTGVSIALPDGYVAFVVPRSGLAARHGLTIVNSPGTVDAGYRGEIRVTLLNTDTTESYPVAVGDRIAQLVVMPVSRARFIPVETLPGSHRGHSGFGSTGYGSTGDGSTVRGDGVDRTRLPDEPGEQA